VGGGRNRCGGQIGEPCATLLLLLAAGAAAGPLHWLLLLLLLVVGTVVRGWVRGRQRVCAAVVLLVLLGVLGRVLLQAGVADCSAAQTEGGADQASTQQPAGNSAEK
jgi:hypothetical protein